MLLLGPAHPAAPTLPAALEGWRRVDRLGGAGPVRHWEFSEVLK